MAKILIIEDNPAVLSLIKDILEAEKLQVDTAANGEEGWNKIKNNTPDLVVLDLSLPDDFGLDICKEIKKTHPKILILICSAMGRSGDVVVGFDSGCDDYLSKPFNNRELIARVKHLLRKVNKID
jgi:DNA-binding response OmpR family regulator